MNLYLLTGDVVEVVEVQIDLIKGHRRNYLFFKEGGGFR
jgi:hypothetical protein